MQKKGDNSFQSDQHPRRSNCGRNHSGRCFGIGGPCFTYGERGHIAKFFPKGESGTSQATTQVQRNMVDTQAQIQPVWAAPQGSRGQGAQVGQGVGGPSRLFVMSRQDVEGSNVVVTNIITVNSHKAYALIDPGSTYSYVSSSFAIFLE